MKKILTLLLFTILCLHAYANCIDFSGEYYFSNQNENCKGDLSPSYYEEGSTNAFNFTIFPDSEFSVSQEGCSSVTISSNDSKFINSFKGKKVSSFIITGNIGRTKMKIHESYTADVPHTDLEAKVSNTKTLSFDSDGNLKYSEHVKSFLWWNDKHSCIFTKID